MKYKSSEQTIGWFKEQFTAGNLRLKPPYQRKPVWMARQKCHLVESVLLDLPIPEVFVQRNTNAEGVTTHSVVDGQQRIRALLQFASSDDAEEGEEFNGFALDKIDSESEFYGLTLAEMTDIQRSDFFGYSLAVRYIDSADDEDVKQMFRRLNSFTIPLKPQELRNATYEGPFARFVDRLAERHTDFLAEQSVLTAAAIRRMGDVEFIAELSIGLVHGPQAGSARAIDEFYTVYEDYDSEFPQQRRVAKAFEATWVIANEILLSTTGRWHNKTDFYSLFVAVGSLKMRDEALLNGQSLIDALQGFGDHVDELIRFNLEEVKDGAANAAASVAYARAVVKGANDLSRRSDRHAALLELITPHH